MPAFCRTLTPMPAQLIDGKALAAKVREEVAAEVEELGEVGLTTVLVGDDPASHVYINGKHKAATGVGIHANDLRLPADTPEDELLQLLADLNADDAVDGILVQLPLPAHIDEAKVIEAIDPAQGHRRLPPDERGPPLPRPPDARAGHAARDHAHARRVRHRDEGRARRRVGRSSIVGKPMAHLLLQANATVTDLPLAHGRPASGTRSTPTSSSRPSGSCT